MASLFSLESIVLLLIAALAFLALVFASPAYNALFLALKTVLIGVYFFLFDKLNTINSSVLILLVFFCLITLTSNIYIEKSTQITPNTAPKLSLLIGTFLLLFFQNKLSQFTTDISINIKVDYSLFSQDITAIIYAVFTIFVILISALAVINTKNIE